MLWVAVMVFLVAPLAGGHPGHGSADQLVEDGRKLVVGSYTGPQPGPLVVVPFVDADVECGAFVPEGATLPLGHDATATFFVNATGLHAVFDLPIEAWRGYAGLAVDTHEATRALIHMKESAVALHALASVVWRDLGEPGEVVLGTLGAPYALPDQAHAHDFEFAPEGGGLLMAHGGAFAGATSCLGDDGVHRGFSFASSALPASLSPGSVVHVVALFDPVVADFLPRPIDGSTRVLQANLYLARPGEDPAMLQRAFDPGWDVGDALPLGFLLVAVAVAAIRRE